METLEEMRYIANTVIPDAVNSFAEVTSSSLEGISPTIWITLILVLIGVIIKLLMQSRKATQMNQNNLDLVERLSRSANGTEIEKIFCDICVAAKGEYLAMYTQRERWYGLTFEINVNQKEKHVGIPLLINMNEMVSEGGKSGNFYITTFFEPSKANMVKIYTHDSAIAPDSDEYRRIEVLCQNGIKLYGLLSSEMSIERRSRIATMTTKLSSSFLSWQYDRERFFFFVSNVIMKSIRALEVIIRDEKNNNEYRYGMVKAQGISEEFYIHHSGYRLTVVTAVALNKQQMNIIGEFVDSSYSLFVHEEDSLKHAEQFLQFLILSNEAMELEFPYFNHHSEMVERISLRIAKSMQLDPKTLKNIEIASKLHDIGMIADVSFSLGKEEKLTEGEMDTIHNHPLYGSIIVEPLNRIYQVGDLIKCHHERYDGKGYPLGLMGDEIPFAAQILGFAEHFSGLISDRPYRPGKPFQKVADEMKQLSARGFNPVLIRAFEQEEDSIYQELSMINPSLKR